MKLNKTSEYAIRVLSYMAVKQRDLYTAGELIDQLHIPQKYLRKMMTDLSKKGFIKSVQGREGGYLFARPMNEIYLSEIIEAVEGIDKYEGCILGLESCKADHPCLMHAAWISSRSTIMSLFHMTSLDGLTAIETNRF